jgi:hypothetical protein
MTLRIELDRIVGKEAVDASLKMAQGITPDDVAGTIQGGVKQVFVDHFLKLNASRSNNLGGKRTNYWDEAAGETYVSVSGSDVVVQVRQVGVRRHLLGGPPITPKGTSEITGRAIKFLTIPIHPSAHGKTVGIFRQQGINLYPAGGALRQQIGDKRSESDPKLYALAKRTKAAQPDPSVIPTVDEIARAADEALNELREAIKDG